MGEQQVPRVQTAIAPAELYTTMFGAWTGLIGSAPQRCSLLVLLAHWSHETSGGHACWNWTLGNAKHVQGDGRDFFVLHCNEFRPDGTEYFVDAQFRAFHGLAEGVNDYLVLMRGRFGYAWPFVEAGEVEDFCHALKQRGYYTAPEQEYAAGVLRNYRQMDLVIPEDPQPVAAMGPEFVPPEVDNS